MRFSSNGCFHTPSVRCGPPGLDRLAATCYGENLGRQEDCLMSSISTWRRYCRHCRKDRKRCFFPFYLIIKLSCWEHLIILSEMFTNLALSSQREITCHCESSQISPLLQNPVFSIFIHGPGDRTRAGLRGNLMWTLL